MRPLAKHQGGDKLQVRLHSTADSYAGYDHLQDGVPFPCFSSPAVKVGQCLPSSATCWQPLPGIALLMGSTDIFPHAFFVWCFPRHFYVPAAGFGVMTACCALSIADIRHSLLPWPRKVTRDLVLQADSGLNSRGEWSEGGGMGFHLSLEQQASRALTVRTDCDSSPSSLPSPVIWCASNAQERFLWSNLGMFATSSAVVVDGATPRVGGPCKPLVPFPHQCIPILVRQS